MAESLASLKQDIALLTGQIALLKEEYKSLHALDSDLRDNSVCIDHLFPQQFDKLGSHPQRERIIEAIEAHKKQAHLEAEKNAVYNIDPDKLIASMIKADPTGAAKGMADVVRQAELARCQFHSRSGCRFGFSCQRTFSNLAGDCRSLRQKRSID